MHGCTTRQAFPQIGTSSPKQNTETEQNKITSVRYHYYTKVGSQCTYTQTNDACTMECRYTYNYDNKDTTRCQDALKDVSSKCRVNFYLCSNLRGNLHIVKGMDKLRELSRVPTCHTNMNANLNVLFIPF